MSENDQMIKIPKWAHSIQSIIGQDLGNRGIKNLLPQASFHFYQSVISLYNSNRIACITGFNIPPPETDGPLGSAAIVKYLVQNQKKDVYMVIDNGCEKVQRAAVDTALQLSQKYKNNIENNENKEINGKLIWSIFNVGDENQNIEEANNILNNTDCLLSIEHLGLASDGKKYSMRGFDKSHLNASTHHIFLKRDKRHIALAIGDGGNEMGFGLVREAVIKYVPLGEKIGDTISADYLIPCGVSNWGGHGLVAGLILYELSQLNKSDLIKLIFGDDQINFKQENNSIIKENILNYLINTAGMMNTNQELEVLDAILKEGSVDGITGKCERSIDNMPYDGNHSKVLNDLLNICVSTIINQLQEIQL